MIPVSDDRTEVSCPKEHSAEWDSRCCHCGKILAHLSLSDRTMILGLADPFHARSQNARQCLVRRLWSSPGRPSCLCPTHRYFWIVESLPMPGVGTSCQSLSKSTPDIWINWSQRVVHRAPLTLSKEHGGVYTALLSFVSPPIKYRSSKIY